MPEARLVQLSEGSISRLPKALSLKREGTIIGLGPDLAEGRLLWTT